MQCSFCQKVYQNKSGYSNHVRRCPNNPNRVIEMLTDAGRNAKKQSARLQNKTKWSDCAFREKHRASMQRAVINNPEAYSSSNRGRTKQIVVDGIKLQGQWEVIFYNWAKSVGLNPTRPQESFPYTWNGVRRYHPDFYISALDLYVEVKGYETDRDRAKWLQFPKTLRIIKEQEINEIRRGTFVGL